MRTKHRYLTQAVLASTFLTQICYADVTIVAPMVNRPTQTSIDGNVTIADTGQLLMNNVAPNNGDAIVVDSDAATILLAPNNVNAGNNAIVTVAPARYGVNIINQTATVGIGAGTGINTVDNAIQINNQLASIDNSGTVQGIRAISITVNGINASIVNEASGVLQGGAGSTVVVGGTGASILNLGTIINNTAQDAVELTQNFNFLINTGTIQSGAGSAVIINGAGAITGNIINGGIFTAAGGIGTGALQIANTLNGIISNNATGVIQTTTGGGGSAVLIQSGFGALSNSGMIQANSAGDIAINVTAPAAGTITNNSSGVIQSNNQAAISLGGGITGITNSGSITNNTGVGGQATIDVTAPNVGLLNGIVNNNIITNNGAGPAIDLQGGGANINVKLTQNAGTITGDALLASMGGAIFDMNGGTINGNVTAALFPTNPDILNLNSGTITGTVTLSNVGDTVNLAGTSLQALVGGAAADTFNVTGGSFTSLDGVAGVDILNINASFTSTGTITNIPVINVNNAGTVFTVNNIITNLNVQLNLAANTSMLVNSLITGTALLITNNGSLAVANGGQIDLPAALLNNNANSTVSVASSAAFPGIIVAQLHDLATSNYSVQIQGPGNYGQIQVGAAGVTLDPGSFISPTLGGGFIPAGTLFDVIRTTGLVNDQSTLVQPASAVVFFTKSGVGGVVCATGPTCVELTANRNSFSSLASSAQAQGVAPVIDCIAAHPPATLDPNLLLLLGQLDLLTTPSDVNTALESLVPPFNNSLAATSHISMDRMFDSLHARLEDLRGLGPLSTEGYTIIPDEDSGYNYGDGYYEERSMGSWIKIYGVALDQKRRHEIDGYLADASGVAFGNDWIIRGDLCGREQRLGAIGFAGSFTKTHAVGQNENANVQDIDSIQGTLYAWFQPMGSLYIDAMTGLVSHKYNDRRNIGIGTLTTSAFSQFYGLQFGAQIDMGYAFLNDNYYIAPLVRAKFTQLEIDNYTEQGAGGIDLSVVNDTIHEVVAGIGIRMAFKNEYVQASYVPEFSAMILYDFDADPQGTSSSFVGAGFCGTFATTGIKPAQTFLQFGLGMTAHTADDYYFTVRYELEIRDHFYGNSAFARLEHRWG